MTDRKLIQDTFIRISQDGGFKMDAYDVAKFVAQLLNIHPLEVGFAFSSLKLMEQVACGEHPAAKKSGSHVA